MQLYEFFDYKKQLIHDLLASEQIVSLLSDDEQPIADPEELFLTRLYPFEYVPEVVTQGQTFICCDVDIQSTVNKTFLTPNLYIWVFTHKTKMMLLKLPRCSTAVGIMALESLNCIPSDGLLQSKTILVK